MKENEISKAFQLIEPGPVVLVTTAHKEKADAMTMSWHMVVDFAPLIGCVIGPWDHGFSALRATGEYVVAIPAVDLMKTVVDTYYRFILRGVKAWIDPDREERRTFHANGDGTFVTDGQTHNLRERTTRLRYNSLYRLR